jgi:hypothetical protein
LSGAAGPPENAAPFSVTVHHGPFLLVVATGDAMICDALGMIDLASRICDLQSYRHALFDLLSVSQHFQGPELQAIASHAAAKLSSVERVASVMQPTAETGRFCRAANEAGLSMRSFSDMREATEWLCRG